MIKRCLVAMLLFVLVAFAPLTSAEGSVDSPEQEDFASATSAPLASPPTASSTSTSGSSFEAIDTVSDWATLSAWLELNAQNGGSVALSADILLPARDDIYTLLVDAAAHVDIDAGPYCIVVEDGATLWVSGAITIQGEGAPKPVITVRSGGSLYDATDSAATFTLAATGVTGIALRLEPGADYSQSVSACPRFRADGARATAISSDVALALSHAIIGASGDGAVGIVCSQDVSLTLCRVVANGESVASTQKVTLDGCVVSPRVPDADETIRTLSKITPYYGTFCFYVGEEVRLKDKQAPCKLLLADVENVKDVNIEAATGILHGENKVYDTPGVYSIPVTLLPPFDALDLAPEGVFMDIIVYDPALPFFQGILKGMGDDEYYYDLSFFYERDDLSELKLWRSNDGGATWFVSWKQGFAHNQPFEVIYDGGGIHLMFRLTDLTGEVLFAFEAETLGGSHVVKLDMDMISQWGPNGGDRDGGDRLPWSLFGNSDALGSVGNMPDNGNANDLSGDNSPSGGTNKPSGSKSHSNRSGAAFPILVSTGNGASVQELETPQNMETPSHKSDKDEEVTPLHLSQSESAIDDSIVDRENGAGETASVAPDLAESISNGLPSEAPVSTTDITQPPPSAAQENISVFSRITPAQTGGDMLIFVFVLLACGVLSLALWVRARKGRT